MNDMTPLAVLKELVGIPSGTEIKNGVNRVGNYLVEKYEKLGFCTVKRQSHETFGDMIHLQYGTFDQKEVKLLLVGHLDTVFNTVTSITVSESEGKLFGPGVNDMKAGLVTMLFALKELEQRHNVGVLLVPEEEQMHPDHYSLLKEVADQYTHVMVFESDNNGVSIPSKRGLVVKRRGAYGGRVRITAAGGHSGLITKKKDMHSAVHSAVEIATKLLKQKKISAGTSVNIGQIIGGTAANSFAQECELLVSARVNTREEYQRMENIMNSVASLVSDKTVSVVFSPLFKIPPMPYCEQNKMFYLRAQRALKGIVATYPEKRGGSSDANRLTYFNPNLAILDNFGTVGGGEHTDKEFVFVDSLALSIRIAAAVIRNLIN